LATLTEGTRNGDQVDDEGQSVAVKFKFTLTEGVAMRITGHGLNLKPQFTNNRFTKFYPCLCPLRIPCASYMRSVPRFVQEVHKLASFSQAIVETSVWF